MSTPAATKGSDSPKSREATRPIPRSHSVPPVQALAMPYGASGKLREWPPDVPTARLNVRISPLGWVAGTSALSFVPCKITDAGSGSGYFREPASGTVKVSTGKES